MTINIERVAAATREALLAVGEDPSREGLRDTPQRVGQMYAEVFQGLNQDPVAVLSTQFEEDHQEMVIVRDTPFYSMCEHHLLPFFGTVAMGYVPRGRVVGISKLARAAEILSKRPQLQERFTSQLADAIMEALAPDGVAVIVRAEHLCMSMRGVRKPGTSVVTSAMRGVFRDSAVTRSEFLTLVNGDRH